MVKVRTIIAWGNALHGAIGRREGHNARKLVPSSLVSSTSAKVIDVSCGTEFTVFAVDSSNKKENLFGLGLNTNHQLGHQDVYRKKLPNMIFDPVPISIPVRSFETRITQLASGRTHLLVLTDKEGVFALGSNNFGQCGKLIQRCDRSNIQNIPDLNGKSIISIECGYDHSIFLTENGEVYSCGLGADGQTGLQHFNLECMPTRVKGRIEGENIVKVSSCTDFVLALNDKGEIFGWGNSEYGQHLLREDIYQVNTPVQINFDSHVGKIVDIAAGGSFCCAINESGHLYVWGNALILGDLEKKKRIKPTEIKCSIINGENLAPDTKFVKVSAGPSTAAAITNKGDLLTWGRNKSNCLGERISGNTHFPSKVINLPSEIIKVSCSIGHMAILCEDNT